ncbi:MAG: DUF4124 domain-containing protein [Gammaproteobacteria bacterium]
MKLIYQNQILIFAVMITTSLTVDAEKVYESVDKEGVVEFSDNPSPSSDAQVKVLEKPNVADTLPAELDKPSSSPSTTSIDPVIEQPEEIHIGGSNYEKPIKKRKKKKRTIGR